MRPYPIDDIRRDMLIQLAVLPNYIFRAIGSPSSGMGETYRQQLVTALTEGWERFEIQRPEINPGCYPKCPGGYKSPD